MYYVHYELQGIIFRHPYMTHRAAIKSCFEHAMVGIMATITYQE